ncbi:MAG: OmpH family outer membrane protein [Pirellulales bacterium]|nr:OmpH family outer membrane protein [Pirellulales bacterium]
MSYPTFLHGKTWIAPLASLLLGAAYAQAQGLPGPAAPNPAAAAVPSSTAVAAAPAAQSSGHRIAVVDVGIIFKQSPRVAAQLEKLKQEAQASGDALKQEYEALRGMAEKLQKSMDPSGFEAKQLEAEITKKKLDFDFRRTQMGKELAEREAKLIYALYIEIDQIVQGIAQRNGIALVIKHNSLEVNPNDKNDIMRGLNNQVVYVHPDLDITKLVMASYK